MRKGLLQNLRVERTDGVDAPATGRTWVIQKSEKGDPARAALAAMEKAGFDLDEDTAAALNALAEHASVEVTFEPAEAEAEESAEKAEAEATEDGEQTEKAEEDSPVKRGEIKDVLKDALAELIEEEKAEKSGGKPLSKQAKGNDEGARTEIKKGEGLFESVIFGQD